MGLPLTCGHSMKIETLTHFTSVEFVAYLWLGAVLSGSNVHVNTMIVKRARYKIILST